MEEAASNLVYLNRKLKHAEYGLQATEYTEMCYILFTKLYFLPLVLECLAEAAVD